MGYALIKLPFHISIGVVPTILWILINIFFAFKIALDKVRLDLNKKINKTLYFVSLTVITLIYLASEYEPVTKIAFFLFSIVIAWIYLKKSKPKIEINKINKDHKSKKHEEEEVKKEKQSGLTFFLTTVMVLVIFGGGILLISNHYNDGSLTFDQQKESYRAKNLYKDEANLCETQIRKRYPKAKFTKVMVSNYYAPQDKLSYEKILNMWADHKVLMINIPWGKIDCKIKVNSDQSIEFLELSKKY